MPPLAAQVQTVLAKLSELLFAEAALTSALPQGRPAGLPVC
jgi:hypothetical protein